MDYDAGTADLDLTSLDLTTGALREYPGVHNLRAAALSPDGRRIAITSSRGLELVDAATGRAVWRVPVGSSASGPALAEGEVAVETAGLVDGDAWSPDGRKIAVTRDSTLTVVDVSGPRPTARELPIDGLTHFSAIGWRDADTILLVGSNSTEIGDNKSGMAWVDAATGASEPFASYTPGLTGAHLWAPDVARDLVPLWQVAARPVDRPLPIGVALTAAVVVAALVGLAAAFATWRLTRSAGAAGADPAAR